MKEQELTSFDREVSFAEVFLGRDSEEFMGWLAELVGVAVLLVGRNGESMVLPAGAESVSRLPHPNKSTLPLKPTRFRDQEGLAAVGIPVFYEGDSFALLVTEEALLEDADVRKRLKLAANIMEWYVHLVHQRRMISELQGQTQAMNYEELLAEHQRVVASERKYKELAQSLEQRVEERKRDLEKTQRQLLQQEKMASIGQLAAGVAHEINNPTGFVNSNLQTLKSYHEAMTALLVLARGLAEKGRDPEEKKLLQGWRENDLDYILQDLPGLVEQSLKGTERIIRIVKGLSRFSHVDKDEEETVNVNELLDSAVELLWNEIKHKATLTKDYENVPPIRANANQLSQVLVNLIVNALQAINREGTITLATRRLPAGVEIQVADNGKGIAPEHLARIFDPFFTTKPVGQGTGLGLSISYEIVKGHGGEIRVESEPWKGTTFFVRLPKGEAKEGMKT
jgi:signal transduction histidine kinase